jgi:hypothetical protein
MRKPIPEYLRFISKVEKTSDCWNWKGTTYRFGYGHFRRKINNKWVMYKAHRYSYEYHNKVTLDSRMFVCHKCDNPKCVNPAHLFSGTARDNHEDKKLKGRLPLIRNPKQKLLNMDTAREIRSFRMKNPKMRLKDIALKWDTSIQQVSRILNNRIWQEVL